MLFLSLKKLREYLCILQLTNSDLSLQDIAAAVSKIEPEKSSKVQEAKSFLVSNLNCASASQLHSKVDEANKKYTKIEQLLQCSQEKYETLYVLHYFIVCGSSDLWGSSIPQVCLILNCCLNLVGMGSNPACNSNLLNHLIIALSFVLDWRIPTSWRHPFKMERRFCPPTRTSWPGRRLLQLTFPHWKKHNGSLQ